MHAPQESTNLTQTFWHRRRSHSNPKAHF